jgi:DNA repair exonuclease SbcCD ATPase subunit
MIILKKLWWSSAFSYGVGNSIDLNKSDLTQLIGKNGHGKSSIALILEEVLYNKNSKGIKKSDILNRETAEKSYSIVLDFDKDGDSYNITTVRGATQTVKLQKNGKDISAHTSTGTYKLIEDIIGFDHKTFTQIVYQSSAYSLEFLTATDSARKKFLIDLLNLGVYTKAADIFKAAAKEVDNEVSLILVK